MWTERQRPGCRPGNRGRPFKDWGQGNTVIILIFEQDCHGARVNVEWAGDQREVQFRAEAMRKMREEWAHTKFLLFEGELGAREGGWERKEGGGDGIAHCHGQLSLAACYT